MEEDRGKRVYINLSLDLLIILAGIKAFDYSKKLGLLLLLCGIFGIYLGRVEIKKI